ncbi:MAG: FtsX-like permease family protein [Anaerolineae bacterium]
MMTFFYNALSLSLLAVKRLWNHRLLMMCLWLGITFAVGIVSAVPLFTDATQNRLLQGELTESGSFRPPFAFMWRYVGAWNGNITAEAYGQADSYLSEQAADEIGLPADEVVRHVSSDKLRLFAGDGGGFDENTALMWSNIGFISNLEDRVRLVEGEFPSSETSGAEIPVLLSQATAERLGAQIGEKFILFGSGRDGAQIPVIIAAIWSPVDPADGFWFYSPDSFNEMVLTTEGQFWDNVAPKFPEPISIALWYLILDGRRVRPGSVSNLLEDVRTVDTRTNAFLNGTALEISPVESLESYDGSAGLLNLNLLIFSLPIIGLVLYFVALIAGLVVRRGQTEIAILHSRGQTRGQILSVYLIQGLFVCSLGLAAGLALGRILAQIMGKTTAFLDTSWLVDGFSQNDLGIVLSPTAIRFAVITAALGLPALLIPALRSSRHTIISLRNLQARDLAQNRPVWQRFFLDFLLLALPLYGWYQLEQQGRIQTLSDGTDPFSNPLLFLVPVLFCFALGLIAIRFLPWIINQMARLAVFQPSTVLLITLRRLGRAAEQYTGSLLLLTLTLSLAIFSASMALTLDNHLTDQIYYQVGADLNLGELGENTERPERPQQPGQPQQPTPTPEEEQTKEEEAKWLFLPVEEHLTVEGVSHAVRVGDYEATASLSGRQQPARILGIDRLDFAQVAYFRRDFASNESLGGVMNRLAVGRNYILVNREFMDRNGLVAGDPLRLNVEAAGEFANIDFVIAAPLDLFPTLYPQDGPFFVAHLDYLHENLGGQFPYDVWLKLEDGVSTTAVVQGVRDLGLLVVSADSATDKINEEALRPERQGLFGLLSVGFGAAALLTVLGFLVFAIVSFRQRLIELGMLRAIGLSVRQMVTYLTLEQAAIISTGMAIGTGLGIWASNIFIPYFQIGNDKATGVPPFEVQIAWGQIGTIYIIFTGMFVCAVSVLIILLLRMKLFEAVKLGETV